MLIRRSKYGARRTTVDGITFHSQREAARYRELRLLERAGAIKELELQPRFLLVATTRGGERASIGSYVADFRYREGPRGLLIIEDVKSPATRTPLYRWKKKHTEAQYGITITEVL